MDKTILTETIFNSLNSSPKKSNIQEIILKDDYIGIRIQDEFFMIMVLDTDNVKTLRKLTKTLKNMLDNGHS